jgi:SAM-dependent methyltransferase
MEGRAPSPDPSDAAAAYWHEHARTVKGPGVVFPNSRLPNHHGWSTRWLQHWTLSRLDRPRFKRVVDLGCGRGEWSALFAPLADEVFACDVAEPFVAETRARLDQLRHTSWHVEQADLRSYHVPRGIDLAYVGAVLLYLRDDAVRDVLYRVRRASVPNALVFVREWCTFNLGRPSTQTTTGFSIHRRPADVVALAESVGLRCLEVRSAPSIYAEMMGNAITHWPPRLAWRLATLYRTRASHTFVFRA